MGVWRLVLDFDWIVVSKTLFVPQATVHALLNGCAYSHPSQSFKHFANNFIFLIISASLAYLFVFVLGKKNLFNLLYLELFIKKKEIY